MRRKRDDECENVKKLLTKMKNEIVAEGRIIGLAGPCSIFDKSVTMGPTDQRINRLLDMQGRISKA